MPRAVCHQDILNRVHLSGCCERANLGRCVSGLQHPRPNVVNVHVADNGSFSRTRVDFPSGLSTGYVHRAT